MLFLSPGKEAALFDCSALRLDIAREFAPVVFANSIAESSSIWLESLSGVLIPIVPSFVLRFNWSFNSWIMVEISVEKVSSVATVILPAESKAIPLLLIRELLFLSIGLSSWIFKVYL